MTSLPLHEQAPIAPGVTERAMSFTVDGCELAANLVRPAQAADLGVVLVHGWSGSRSGPHDLLTTLSRRLAANGLPALRFDLRGRGESEGNGEATTLANMAADTVAAARALRSETAVKRIVYVGMCSGGNVIIGALPRLTTAVGVILLSVYPFSDGDSFGRDVHRTLHYVREYAHKALRLRTWQRLLGGDIRIRQVLAVLFGHFQRQDHKRDQALAPVPTAAATPENRAGVSHLAHLRGRVPTLLVYGSADPDTTAARRYYETYAREHDLPMRVVEIAGANHNFSSTTWADTVVRLAADFCRDTVSTGP